MEHNVHILISLDGPASIHNRSRRFASNGEGTFEAVSNILETLKRTVPGFSKLLFYNSVVDPCNDIHCVVNFFSEQNFEINNKMQRNLRKYVFR